MTAESKGPDSRVTRWELDLDYGRDHELVEYDDRGARVTYEVDKMSVPSYLNDFRGGVTHATYRINIQIPEGSRKLPVDPETGEPPRPVIDVNVKQRRLIVRRPRKSEL